MEVVFILEALLVVAIIGYQFYVYRGTKSRIELLKNLYPTQEKLAVKATAFGEAAPANAASSTTETQWQQLLTGKPFKEYALTNLVTKRAVSADEKTVQIESMDGNEVQKYDVSIERLQNLLQNGKIFFLEEGFVNAPAEKVGLSQNAVYFDLIEVQNPSATFSKIIHSTNEYLKRNKGAAADFNILKDISERYAEALDNEVQATVASPLYIGLLGTFSGVIIGLSSLVFAGFSAGDSEVSSFITDQNIPSFLFGVLIAMAGSFCGLLLTLRGNYELKDARSTRDRLKNDYYTFLQAYLLPKLNSDMAASLGNLKAVLDSFNKDFLDKIMGFRPIVDTLTENISIQKDFVERLDKIGFTQMANANLMVFDKLKESEYLFQNFIQYQVALNESVQKGAELTGTIERVLSRLTGLEEGFNKMPGYLEKHDESIRRQVNFFSSHEQELQTIAARVEQYFDKATLQLTNLMEARLEHHERDAQNAYSKWQEHFSRLNNDNVYQRIVEYMQPFSHLKEEQEKLNQNQLQLAQSINQSNERFMQKLEADAEVQRRLLEQITLSNALMAKQAEPGPLKAALNKVFGTGDNRKR
ncbi:hypothetical protein [Pontibacter arcticus]|uniref:MotA/TolQ/ExbB proton channel family protein n=1 Tax=Pontibacter arcticus TaxID=2080288 RepID=A0A364REG7_9BACT|nr:hypothetical protein [Pontibacter arcticus]RAU82738.1 hypothetical protein DP923_05640 [Pontibacter arcticus]